MASDPISTGVPSQYAFAQWAVHAGVMAQDTVAGVGVHVSLEGLGGPGPKNNIYLPLREAVRLVLGLQQAVSAAINHAGPEACKEAQRALANATPFTPVFKERKAFRVAVVSGNTNSFGLTGLVIVAQDGMAWEVGVSTIHLRKKGDLVRLPMTNDQIEPTAEFMFEIPKRLVPDAPAAVVKEVWG
jgi:hypothetical protein